MTWTDWLIRVAIDFSLIMFGYWLGRRTERRIRGISRQAFLAAFRPATQQPDDPEPPKWTNEGRRSMLLGDAKKGLRGPRTSTRGLSHGGQP